MKKLPAIACLSAMILLFGHTFIPHEHPEFCSDSQWTRHDHDINFYDILKNGLTTNHGANHLENFQHESRQSCNYQTFTPSEILILSESQNVNVNPYLTKEIIIDDKSINSLKNLRAPPVCASSCV